VSLPKHRNAPAGEAEAHQRHQRKKDKMIRLDDLIPKKNVLGGRGLMIFGASQTQTINPKQES
jgi:hypothetical protein